MWILLKKHKRAFSRTKVGTETRERDLTDFIAYVTNSRTNVFTFVLTLDSNLGLKPLDGLNLNTL